MGVPSVRPSSLACSCNSSACVKYSLRLMLLLPRFNRKLPKFKKNGPASSIFFVAFLYGSVSLMFRLGSLPSVTSRSMDAMYWTPSFDELSKNESSVSSIAEAFPCSICCLTKSRIPACPSPGSSPSILSIRIRCRRGSSISGSISSSLSCLASSSSPISLSSARSYSSFR